MERRRLGLSGQTVSRLGLGTLTWGRDCAADEAARLLREFVAAGGDLVDTADVYSDGESERILGRLLHSEVPREEVFLATKAGMARGRERTVDASRRHLLAALDGSLRRLGVDHVDLWLVHGHDPHTPAEETLAALDVAVTTGRTRYVGVCDLTGWQLAEAATWQRAWPGRSPLVAAQMEYSLLERGIEREVGPAARALGVGLLARSPLGRGVLTGKYRAGLPADSRAASADLAEFVRPYLDERGRSIVESVVTAADGLGVSPLGVALAWVRDRPGVAAAVVGPRTAGQLAAILDAEHVALPYEIRDALDDVSAETFGYPQSG